MFAQDTLNKSCKENLPKSKLGAIGNYYNIGVEK